MFLGLAGYCRAPFRALDGLKATLQNQTGRGGARGEGLSLAASRSRKLRGSETLGCPAGEPVARLDKTARSSSGSGAGMAWSPGFFRPGAGTTMTSRHSPWPAGVWAECPFVGWARNSRPGTCIVPASCPPPVCACTNGANNCINAKRPMMAMREACRMKARGAGKRRAPREP